MFETVSDADLLTFMGEETREESAAMGRRLASVGELFERRNPGFVVADLCAADAMTAVAAESEFFDLYPALTASFDSLRIGGKWPCRSAPTSRRSC